MLDKPNIVFILADDLGEWALGCYGNKEIITPNIDKLASYGVRFTNFFCTSPVCSPARASIMTGRIPSQHGVHDWIRSGNVDFDKLNSNLKKMDRFEDEKKTIQYLDAQTTYTEILAQNDYKCGLSGKWHLGDSLTPQKGFTNWFTIARGGCSYYSPDIVENGEIKIKNEYITDLITEDAVNYLDTFKDSKEPFYLSIHYTAPHGPWGEGEHPKEIVDLYKTCSFDSVPNKDIHPWQCNTCQVGVGEKRIELLKGYYAAVTAMDKGIGRIIDKLEKNHMLNNTLIIFTSDNGMNMGHHGIWGKGNGTFPQNMYDTSVKVPFIISMPKLIDKGVNEDSLLSQYDIMPTLLEILDIEYDFGNDLPGKSFAGILKGEEASERQHVVVYDEYGPVRMIRNNEYKYVHRYPYGPHEFYDMVNDSNEENNLVEDSQYKSIIENMRQELGEWFINYVNPNVDGTKEAVTGKGQVVRAGINSNGKKIYEDDFKIWNDK